MCAEEGYQLCDVFTDTNSVGSAVLYNQLHSIFFREGHVSQRSNWRITMRKFAFAAFLLLLVSILIPRIAAAEDRDRKPDLLVDDDKVQCPTAPFTSIKDAINTPSPSHLIRV